MNRHELSDKLAVMSLGRIMLVQCQLFFFFFLFYFFFFFFFFFSGNLMLCVFGEYSPYFVIFFLEILQW